MERGRGRGRGRGRKWARKGEDETRMDEDERGRTRARDEEASVRSAWGKPKKISTSCYGLVLEVVARSVSRWLVRQALWVPTLGGGWKGARTFSW